MAQYFVLKDGREIGPMDGKEVKRLAGLGQIAPGDQLRRDGDPKWTPASSVPALFPAAPAGAAVASSGPPGPAQPVQSRPESAPPAVPQPRPVPPPLQPLQPASPQPSPAQDAQVSAAPSPAGGLAAAGPVTPASSVPPPFPPPPVAAPPVAPAGAAENLANNVAAAASGAAQTAGRWLTGMRNTMSAKLSNLRPSAGGEPQATAAAPSAPAAPGGIQALAARGPFSKMFGGAPAVTTTTATTATTTVTQVVAQVVTPAENFIARMEATYQGGHPDYFQKMTGVLVLEESALRFVSADATQAIAVPYERLADLLEPRVGAFPDRVVANAQNLKTAAKGGKLAAGIAGTLIGGKAGRLVSDLGKDAAGGVQDFSALGGPPRNRLTALVIDGDVQHKVYFDSLAGGREELEQLAQGFWMRAASVRKSLADRRRRPPPTPHGTAPHGTAPRTRRRARPRPNGSPCRPRRPRSFRRPPRPAGTGCCAAGNPAAPSPPSNWGR